MKKILIGTSALVAAVAFSGAANAADPIKLSVGGFAKWFVGYADQTNAANDLAADWDVKGNAEVHFKGKTTLDNGLTVAVVMEHEAGGRSQGTIIDESYVTIGSDAIGTLKIGTDDNAAALIAMGPKSFALNGLEESDIGDWITIAGRTANTSSTYIATSNDTEKLTYISPSFGGFAFGASLIPSVDDVDQDNTITNTAGTNVIGPGYGVGALYKGEFSGVAVGIESAYVWANPQASNNPGDTLDKHAEWQVGGTVGVAGFTIGAAMRQIDQENVVANVTTDTQHTTWDAGVAYETGPYGVALAYIDGESEVGNASTTWNMWQLSGQYTMGPGVSLNGEIDMVEDTNSDTGWAAITGLVLSF